jgi:hypothetical protein
VWHVVEARTVLAAIAPRSMRQLSLFEGPQQAYQCSEAQSQARRYLYYLQDSGHVSAAEQLDGHFSQIAQVLNSVRPGTSPDH